MSRCESKVQDDFLYPFIMRHFARVFSSLVVSVWKGEEYDAENDGGRDRITIDEGRKSPQCYNLDRKGRESLDKSNDINEKWHESEK